MVWSFTQSPEPITQKPLKRDDDDSQLALVGIIVCSIFSGFWGAVLGATVTYALMR